MSHFLLNTDAPFPVIKSLTAFKDAVGSKEEIRFMEQSNGTIVGCYLIAMDSTFDNPYARECRGIVFNKDGDVISRPLSKFFNVNEKASTQTALIPWDSVVRCMNKRDGSMIHTVKVGIDKSPFDCSLIASGTGMLHTASFDIKSKKSFSSDVAKSAGEFLAKNLNYRDFCETIVYNDYTAIFEWTSPTARIVLPYVKDELKLLHIRENVSGKYFTRDDLESWSWIYDIPLCEDVDLNGKNYITTTKSGVPFEYTITADRPLIDQFLELVETMVDTEGWIFQFANGDMLKLKTADYMRKHRIMTFLRERDIAEAVIEESVDDLKAALSTEGVDITEIVSIENDVVQTIEAIIHSVETRYDFTKSYELSNKDIALSLGPVSATPYIYFSLLMNRVNGKEPDYKEYFRKNILRERYTLRQLNLMQSVAETE